MRCACFATVTLMAVAVHAVSSCPAAGAVVSGELKKWHRVTLTFDGPSTSESATPNPFRNYRLNVTFINGSTTHVVPGFYAADGNAAETGATSGNKWRVHFTPDLEGTWSYAASFRTGSDVAMSADPNAGTATSFDGDAGSFVVGPTDKSGNDYRGKGLLRYVSKHHLQFAESGEYYLKAGADSPENFLAYDEFDNTYDTGGIIANFLHYYAPHAGDWQSGDPTWQGGKGKNIIGILNYLASQGGNSVYFITYNIDGGDGADTWPWNSTSNRDRYDCSKLDQWEIVFAHMDKLGIQLHLLTQETENDQALDGGNLGPVRKLYYRELISRFAHHLALQWNLGEENSNTDAQLKDFSSYIRGLDPYDHPIAVHTNYNKADTEYDGILGDPNFEATSIQGDGTKYNGWAISLRRRTAQVYKPWAIYGDEQGPAVDDNLSNLDTLRKSALWGNLMGGGAGIEWYFGYQGSFGDVQSEDWRVAEPLWQQTRYAVDFFQTHLPFAEMQPNNDLVTGVTGALAINKPGHVYAVYLPGGGSPNVSVAAAVYDVRWYNPRSGGALQTGSVSQVTGPGAVNIGSPPSDTTNDWAALLSVSGMPATYSLNVSSGLGDGAYPAASIVTVRADAPPSGKIFDQWTGDTAAIANVLSEYTTVTMPAAPVNITATYKDAPAGPTVVSFTLIDADADQPIAAYDPLPSGTTLNLAALPTSNLSIRANTSPATVGSVKFGLDGNSDYRMESVAPYALEGDSNGDYTAWTPGIGSHTMTGTPYTQSGGGGTAGTPLTITFDVIDQDINTPPTINLTQPAQGASLTSHKPVTLAVNTQDVDGTVVRVDYYADQSNIATLLSPPFATTWTPTAAGDYALTATATDDDADSTTSLAVAVRVYVPGDLDRDTDVDQTDFGLFQACYSAQPQSDPACGLALLDTDTDVDDDDFDLFVACYSGPDALPVPTCPQP